MQRTLTGKKIALIAGTRVALGIGIGLLLARRLTYRQARVAGIALASAGALSTIPIAIAIRRKRSLFRDIISAA
jgi:hypothetical protein